MYQVFYVLTAKINFAATQKDCNANLTSCVFNAYTQNNACLRLKYTLCRTND